MCSLRGGRGPWFVCFDYHGRIPSTFGIARYNLPMRKLLVALVLLLGAFFIIGHFAEMQAVWETLQRGDWRILLLALLVEAAWMLNVAASYRAIYRALGMEESIGRLLLLTMGANFVNVVAPSAGVGGVAVFIGEAKRRGYSQAKATIAGALYIFIDYMGFLAVMAIGLVVLIRRNHLTVAELTAAALIALIALGIGTVLYLGMRSEERLKAFLIRLARIVNRVLFPFLKRDYLSEERAREFAHDSAEGLAELRDGPENLLLPALLSLSNKALMILVFTLMFLAFKVPISVGTLIAGFCIGYLFTIISPTPWGVGVMEPALTLALNSFFVPLGAAAVIVLAYRGFTFWLPLLVGLVAMRLLGRTEAADAAGADRPLG